MNPISIIIPTLNEEAHLPKTLAAVAGIDKCEVILVDGGSSDQSVAVATQYGCTVLPSPPGRAKQMNTGATVARGEIFIFLHADTVLPCGFSQTVSDALSRKNVIAGAFSLQLDNTGLKYRIICRGANIRSSLLQLPYGDQALFIKKDTFQQLGGYPDLPIMEDYAFVKLLKSHGHISILPDFVISSARRWENLGVMKTTCINQIIVFSYHLGIAPHRLARWYQRLKGIRRP